MKTFDLEGAAAFLHVSKDSMRDMADSGRVPGAKIGPGAGYRWVFTEESLEEYLRDEIRRQTAERRGIGQGIGLAAKPRREMRKPPALRCG